jgi:hypothetical protein
MKPLSMALVLLVVFSSIAQCEERTKDDASAASPSRTQFLVTLSEYHLEGSIPVKASEAEILDIMRGAGAIPVETVRMTATLDTESMVQFGKRVTVTTGSVTRGPTTSRQTQSMEIGTILQVRIESNGDGVIAEVDYSTSRLSGSGTDDSPPDVLTTTVKATQIYELGKQRLLTTSSTGDAPCIIVSIQHMP